MSERYRQGLAAMLAMARNTDGLVSDVLASEAPDFARLLVEAVFADLFSRDGLDRRTRLFVAIGALAAQGDARTQLRWFVQAALETGTARDEVIEALMQVAAFAGFFPAAQALEACADLLADQSGADGACPVGMAAR